MEAAQRQFEALYDTHANAIFAYLSWRLSDRERAKELTQEVFMRVWRHLAEGKPIAHEKAFLYTIAKRLFINEIRGAPEAYSLDALTDDTGFELTDEEAASDTVATSTELWDMVQTLSPATQELLRLRYQDGLSVQEIALIFEARENTISMRISRAIEQLQKKYHPDSHHDNK